MLQPNKLKISNEAAIVLHMFSCQELIWFLPKTYIKGEGEKIRAESYLH